MRLLTKPLKLMAGRKRNSNMRMAGGIRFMVSNASPWSSAPSGLKKLIWWKKCVRAITAHSTFLPNCELMMALYC